MLTISGKDTLRAEMLHSSKQNPKADQNGCTRRKWSVFRKCDQMNPTRETLSLTAWSPVTQSCIPGKWPAQQLRFL